MAREARDRIKLVTGTEEQPEVKFTDAARALLERVLAESTNVLIIGWEDNSGILKFESVPKSTNVAKGLIDGLYEKVHPEPTITIE